VENANSPISSLLLRPYATLLLLILVFIITAHFDLANFIEIRNKERVIPCLATWDENHYYAYAHSLAFDGDLDFTNEFKFLAFGPIGIGMNDVFRDEYFLEPHTPMTTKVGIGVGILSLPFILAARIIVGLYEILRGTEINRFAAFYVWAYKLSMLFWAFTGIVAGYLLLRRLGKSHGIAAFSMLSAVLGLSLGYYVLFASAWSHTVSFGWVTLYLLTCYHWRVYLFDSDNPIRKPNIRSYISRSIMLGIIAGFCCTIRFNNFIILPIPFIICGYEYLHRNNCGKTKLYPCRKVVLLSIVFFLAGTVIGFSPQILAWRAICGKLLVNSYARFGGERLYPWSKYFFHVLFHLRCGLFLWTPLAILAVIGLILSFRRERPSPWPLICLYILIADVWFSGSWPGWDMGDTFGARYQSDYTFVFAYGLAALFTSVQIKPLLHRIVGVAVVFLIVWNLYLMTAYRAGVIVRAPRTMPEPFWFRSLFTENRRILNQWNKDLRLLYRLDYYWDYTRRYPLMTPADLGLPAPLLGQ
jgi:hypothetical protein